MLRRVEDQRRVKDGEAERRENLNEEQHGRSLRSRGETTFKKSHPPPISLVAPFNVKPPHGGRVAHSSRVLVAVSRRDELPLVYPQILSTLNPHRFSR